VTGEPLTDLELRDELMTLLAAGHETTATALTWALYWIHKFPGVRERLLEEFRTIDPNDHVGFSRLPYLNAVCSETLRIYPVGMLTFPRVTTSTIDVMGYSLRPGTVVLGAIYLTHRRKEIYPEPEQFRPERFLERRFSAYEYLPFGGGARRCIGMAFAQFEMKLVIRRILSSVELALTESRPVRPTRRGLTAGPTPFRMVVKNRVPDSLASEPVLGNRGG
jgi:cytochrome P450